MVNCMGCTRRLIQFLLIIVNIIVSLLGMAVMIIGIWALVNERRYFEISDNEDEFTQVSVLMIVVGVFVMIVGVVGTVGAIFGGYLFGRIVLGLYAVVLSALIICEIAGGIAAAVLEEDLETEFRRSANKTFMDYNVTSSTWNTFQHDFECCGVEGYQDYRQLFPNNSVPVSCCDKSMVMVNTNCTEIVMNVTSANEQYIYDQGCVDAVVDSIKNNLASVAAGAIVIGLLQIVAVVMACFVAIYKGPEHNKYEVV